MTQKFADRVIAKREKPRRHRIKQPRLAMHAGGGRSLVHTDRGRGRQRADIDNERVGDGDELVRLLRRVNHRRRGAQREKRVGGDIHRDKIRDVLDKRATCAGFAKKLARHYRQRFSVDIHTRPPFPANSLRRIAQGGQIELLRAFAG